MRRVVAILWQTGLLLVVAFLGFVGGMAVPAFRVQRVLSHTDTSTRTYDFNWLIAVFAVYLLLLVVGAIRKRFAPMLLTATIALVIAAGGLALFTQIGIKDVTPY